MGSVCIIRPDKKSGFSVQVGFPIDGVPPTVLHFETRVEAEAWVKALMDAEANRESA
jgi:hypothetical protein